METKLTRALRTVCEKSSLHGMEESTHHEIFKTISRSFVSCQSKEKPPNAIDEFGLHKLYSAKVPFLSIIAFCVALENEVYFD